MSLNSAGRFTEFQIDDEHKQPHIPERRLLWAILHRAVWDALGLSIGSSDTPQAVLREVRAWFRTNKKTPFSYLWICQTLEIDPARLRKLISGHAKVERAQKGRIRHNMSCFTIEFTDKFIGKPTTVTEIENSLSTNLTSALNNNLSGPIHTGTHAKPL